MTNLILVVLALLVIYFGTQILSELKRPTEVVPLRRDAGEEWEYRHRVQSISIEEQAFKVEFIEDWEIGRTFWIYGRSIDAEYENESPLQLRERVTIEVRPSSKWFEHGGIGYFNQTEGVAGECRVRLPYQIAKQMLDEFRSNPEQILNLGIKAVAGRHGKPHYIVTDLEFGGPHA